MKVPAKHQQNSAQSETLKHPNSDLWKGKLTLAHNNVENLLWLKKNSGENCKILEQS